MNRMTFVLMLVLVCMSVCASAETVIHTKDGRSIRVPVEGQDIASIEFTTGTIGATGQTNPQPSNPQTTGGRSFSGTWDTLEIDDGNLRVTLTMTQSGAKVTGSYNGEGSNGTISGTVSGNVLKGTFQNNLGNSGSFQFTLSADGRNFSGYYVFAGKNQRWVGDRR